MNAITLLTKLIEVKKENAETRQCMFDPKTQEAMYEKGREDAFTEVLDMLEEE